MGLRSPLVEDGENTMSCCRPATAAQQPADLQNLYVRSQGSGELIPLANLVSLHELASRALNRFNRLRAITISAGLASGYTVAEALAFAQEIIAEELPQNAQIDYKGESRDYLQSGGAVLFTFAMALLIVYLVLAAQFESFIHPLVIMLTVPLAVLGALLGIGLFGSSLNLFSQIGIVMLIGLAAKNGILIVEFANQLRDRGRSVHEAISEAAGLRLRPILMTTLATIFGALPLVLAGGPGSASRSTIGIVIITGVAFHPAVAVRGAGLHRLLAPTPVRPASWRRPCRPWRRNSPRTRPEQPRGRRACPGRRRDVTAGWCPDGGTGSGHRVGARPGRPDNANPARIRQRRASHRGDAGSGRLPAWTCPQPRTCSPGRPRRAWTRHREPARVPAQRDFERTAEPVPDAAARPACAFRRPAAPCAAPPQLPPAGRPGAAQLAVPKGRARPVGQAPGGRGRGPPRLCRFRARSRGRLRRRPCRPVRPRGLTSAGMPTPARQGHLRFELYGRKLRGGWHLVRSAGPDGSRNGCCSRTPMALPRPSTPMTCSTARQRPGHAPGCRLMRQAIRNPAPAGSAKQPPAAELATAVAWTAPGRPLPGARRSPAGPPGRAPRSADWLQS